MGFLLPPSEVVGSNPASPSLGFFRGLLPSEVVPEIALADAYVQPRTAVGAPALLKDRHQLGLQPPVLHSPGKLVFVQVVGIPARRDLQSVGHFRDGMFALHLLHQRKAPLGISADTMPKAFFKMSLCRRR